MIDENVIEKDDLDREYDYSYKGYKVLCRTGWVEPSYIYRHKTNKALYRVKDNDCIVDVTEDHSLFNIDKQKIAPTEIENNTKLEYKNVDSLQEVFCHLENEIIDDYVNQFNNKQMHRIPIEILNADKENQRYFLNNIDLDLVNLDNKVLMAGVLYLRKNVN